MNKLQELKYKSYCNKIRQHLILGANGHTFAADVRFLMDGDIPKAHIIIDCAFPALSLEFKEALPLPQDMDGLEKRLADLFSRVINKQIQIALTNERAQSTEYTVILVDGNNLAHRCKHVYKLSYQGQDTSIQYGVLRSLTTLYRKFNPFRILVAFDKGFPARRRELVSTYKISRHKDESDDYLATRAQIDKLHDWLPRFGVFTTRLDGYEADDLIAQYSRYLEKFYQRETQRTLIVSGDKDLYQLVGPRVDVCDPMKLSKIITLENFKEVTGVSKESYLLYRTLVGDTSDEVPGVYGIGEVKGKKIVEKFPTLNALKLGLLQHNCGELSGFELKSLMTLLKNTYDCIDLQSQRFPKIMQLPLNFEDDPLQWKTVEADLLTQGFHSLITDDLFREMVIKFTERHGLVGNVS